MTKLFGLVYQDDIASGKVVDVVYMDFQQAFDTFPLARLLKNSKHMVLRGALLAWITEYVRDRPHDDSERRIVNGWCN